MSRGSGPSDTVLDPKILCSGVIPPGYKKYGIDFFPKYGQKLENMDIFNALYNHFVPVLCSFGNFFVDNLGMFGYVYTKKIQIWCKFIILGSIAKPIKKQFMNDF